jgi:uncharacterized protein YecE (DUF72 family)
MIHIGTSGWHYPTGRGTWNGVFYPARRPRGFDELAYYAEHFDTVEVNATFYRMPEPDLSRAWLRRTPADFTFSIKLFQQFTHPDMFLAQNGVPDWDVSAAEIDQFRAGVDPIALAGRMAAVLVQFPPSFHAGPEADAYLDWLLGGLRGYPLAVELRHRSWSDAGDATAARLAAHGAAWTWIDEPHFSSSIRQDRPADTGPGLTYIRLHGRNAAAWWDAGETEDRYDYHYAPAELQPFAARARAASAAGRRVLLYMNNHFSAKSVANAAVLKHVLDQPVPGEYPAEMLRRYPELEGVVSSSGLPF